MSLSLQVDDEIGDQIHDLTLDEVRVDQVDDEVVEVDDEVGKKSDLFQIIILYFFRKCLY
jgi:hypothetical protein